MMFPNSRIYCLQLIIILFFISAFNCTSKKNYGRDSPPVDTLEIDGGFFPNEKICVKANDSTVFQREIITSKKMIRLHDYFLIAKQEITRLSIQTFIGNRKYIDTTFVITTSFGGIRAIGGSICYPKFVPISSLIDKEPDWGYLPPDSCRRYFSIQSDTAKYLKY